MPTIGVAVAIPEPWASELQDYRTAIGDATASRIPTHITLLPPCDLDAETLDKIEQHLADVARSHERFPVHLRSTDTFRPVSPVVFVSLVEGISQCERLAEAVRQGPLDLDLLFPYHPHVTVAHHLEDDLLDRALDDLAGFECEFTVTEFRLYVHDAAAGWQSTHDFALSDLSDSEGSRA